MNDETEKTLEDEIEFEEDPQEEEPAEGTAAVCPFCGQIVILKRAGQVPEEVCQCSGADDWRLSEYKYSMMQVGIDALFGEKCDEINPSFTPVSEEAAAMLRQFAREVAFERVFALTLTLPDGSVCGMKRGKVSRKVAVKAER